MAHFDEVIDCCIESCRQLQLVSDLACDVSDNSLLSLLTFRVAGPRARDLSVCLCCSLEHLAVRVHLSWQRSAHRDRHFVSPIKFVQLLHFLAVVVHFCGSCSLLRASFR